jgi:hypothetical protein
MLVLAKLRGRGFEPLTSPLFFHPPIKSKKESKLEGERVEPMTFPSFSLGQNYIRKPKNIFFSKWVIALPPTNHHS